MTIGISRRQFHAALGWGATSILLYPRVTMPYQLFLLFILAGAGIRGMAALASVRAACVAYLTGTCFPMSGVLFAEGSFSSVATGLLLLGFWGSTIALASEVRALLVRSSPLFVAALGAAFVNGLFGAGGPSLLDAAATGLRLIAIALAGIAAFVTIDPTDLADALMQHLRAPPRFAVGALAAFRLLPIFATEWDTIGLARRARGIDDAGSWLTRAWSFRERAFTLLVAAIRRGVRLALAMDARGFATLTCRTIARPQPFTARDRLLLLASVLIAVGTIVVGSALGTWRGLFR